MKNAAGGEDKIKKRHAQGKMTGRERIDYFFDPGTFVELQGYVQHRSSNFGLEKKKFYGDGVITGFGKVDDRTVYAYSQDFTILGGSLGEMHAKKIVNVMDLAMKAGAPVVGINDSGGARIQEGISSLAGYGDIFYRNTMASGGNPSDISNSGPPCAGAVYIHRELQILFFSQIKPATFLLRAPKLSRLLTKRKLLLMTWEDLKHTLPSRV